MRQSPAGLFVPEPTDAGAAPAPPAAGCALVRAAGNQVCDQWKNETADATDLEEVRGVVDALVTAIETGADPSECDGRTRSALGRRLVQLLRRSLILQWTDQPDRVDAATMAQTLQAVERVQERVEPNWSEYFARRLSEPDGLDLVVEVAHDLRSPLTSILFLAETLQKQQSGPVNDMQHRQLGLIYAAGLGLSSLASNVIELARAGDRLVDDDPAPFSVAEVLESVRDIVRPIAEEKGLTVRVAPPVSDQRMGHPIALSRVLLNLTTNALKFTDEGFVELSVKTTDMSTLEFSIRDSGHGIAPAALENLYQPFRRAAGREGYRFSGTGLGLAISRKLVEAMGATLRVETKPGEGTRFFFSCHMPTANQQ